MTIGTSLAPRAIIVTLQKCLENRKIEIQTFDFHLTLIVVVTADSEASVDGFSFYPLAKEPKKQQEGLLTATVVRSSNKMCLSLEVIRVIVLLFKKRIVILSSLQLFVNSLRLC